MACVYPDACRYNTGIIMKASRQRLFILTLLFIVTAINYMDRANLAVAG
ncbi:MFS transporter, partial [Salmonella enterica]